MHSQTKDWFLCFTNAWFRASLGSCFLNAFKVWGLYSNMFFTCAWFKVIEFRIMFYKYTHSLRIRFTMFYKCIIQGKFRIMFSKCIQSLRIIFYYVLHVHDSRWSSLGSCFTNAFTVWELDSTMFYICMIQGMSLGSCFTNAFTVWGWESTYIFCLHSSLTGPQTISESCGMC